MAGINSQGIKLAYADKGSESFTDLTNLQEIPEHGGDVDKLERTTLDDTAHTYIDGIENYGDSIPYKFLYEKEQFILLNGFKGTEYDWKCTLKDGTCYKYSGMPSVKLDGAGVNAVLTYTLSITPTSAMVVA